MTSRRPMTRSYSGNGRTSSFSEGEGSSSNGRSESRNTYLSNVRPENSYSRYSHYRPTRSTLCTVMAQLTEDIQPSFETTVKSKAVSENCNVKLTCVVSGYPAPELKWYKDDMEMDRYCGLPKYEIRRNGKTHTLHIYNCTLDDAAIYQASASNSKGIVSCSGVLEVGTMSEYQIHQRFFAKLKQKAEKKRKDMDEQNKKEAKENNPREKPQVSPERPQRKRPIPEPEQIQPVKEPEVVKQPPPAAEPNGVSFEVKETAPVAAIDSSLEKEIPPPEDTLLKKKMKITNDVETGVNSSRSHMMGNGGENCYDGGISLAQFLAETLQSQDVEEKQNASRVENPTETDIYILNASREREEERKQKEKEAEEKAREQEYEREKERSIEREREKELSIEREREKERLSETPQRADYSKHGPEVKHRRKAHKDHDHHHIQASISTMLHTVKDFFFGKGKKDSNEPIENHEGEFDHLPSSTEPCSPQSQTPPSYWLQEEHHQEVDKPLADEVVPMDTDSEEPSECADIEQQSVSLKVLTPHEHEHDDIVHHTDLPPAHVLHSESKDELTGESVKVADDPLGTMEVSVAAGISVPAEDMALSVLIQVPTEAEEKDSQMDSGIKAFPLHQQEPDCLVDLQQSHHPAATEESCPSEHISVVPQSQATDEEECAPTSNLNSFKDSSDPLDSDISATDSQGLCEAHTFPGWEKNVVKMSREGEHDAEEDCSSDLCFERKIEVKSDTATCSDVSRPEITELKPLERRIEIMESITPDDMLSPQSSTETQSLERDWAKEEAQCISLTPEINVGVPLTADQEMGDLKIQKECTLSLADESKDDKETQSSNSVIRSSEEGREMKEVLICALAKDLGDDPCENLKEQETATAEYKSAEATDAGLEFETEAEKKTTENAEELVESKPLTVTENQEGKTNDLEEAGGVAHQDSNEKQLCWTSEKVPQIQISLCIGDTADLKPTLPDLSPMEHFSIPKSEIMEPELKEFTLPLSILALDKAESEPAFLQKNDAADVIIQNKGGAYSSGLLPTQKGMQNDNNLQPTEKVKEIAQSDDETEKCESTEKSSEKLPKMNYASIPVINVSCIDDGEDDAFVKTLVSDTRQPFETPTTPLFMVPPISVTCHESDCELRKPIECEWTETDTSAGTQRGTKCEDDGMNMKPEKKEKQDDRADRSITENSRCVPDEVSTQKVDDKLQSLIRSTEENIVPEILKVKPLKDVKIENSVTVEDLLRNRSSVERLSFKPPTHPSLSPASVRKKAAQDSENEAVTGVPVITVDDHQSDRLDEDFSGGSTPTSSLSCESSPRLKRRDSLSLMRSATPEELASGARRKIFLPKAKEDGDGVVGAPDIQSKKESPYMSPSQARRAALLQAPVGQNTPPMERRSPLLSRRKATLDVPKVVEETPTGEKPAEKKLDPLKAPQVIRKIRGEPFPDASGHLKLWCQFFNVLSDSTIKWFRDEEEILEVKRSGGDESQVALTIVLASSHDCGVYGCTIKNEYGTDTTDFLLSVDILSDILLREDLEVGEEIEMTPLLFNKGLANSGNWGDKFFGRIMTETMHVGEGCSHKASRVKAIYGLDPVFESGSTCIIKVQSPIPYGTKQERSLAERNLEVTKQECRIQNMIREYCKIFAAEARDIDNFGASLEVNPQYLMYRPANSVPYATVESDLKGVFLKYCMMDPKGRLITRNVSEVEQKCSAFQHWIHQWTHGNLLVTRMEGVGMKITNIRVVTKSKGYQGLTEVGSPEVVEQFLTHHQCNYYCGLVGLRPLKTLDSLQQPTKIKSSRSPLLNRKLGSGSPQLQRKANSPQISRKANSSPKVIRKVQETEDNKSGAKDKPAETPDVLEMSYRTQRLEE